MTYDDLKVSNHHRTFAVRYESVFVCGPMSMIKLIDVAIRKTADLLFDHSNHLDVR